jgi:pepF/M3 family oligoendopeptidase
VELPRWDLSNVYPSLDSAAYAAGGEQFKRELDELAACLGRALPAAMPEAGAAHIAGVLGEAVERFNSLYELAATRRAYITGFVATDSRNSEAAKALSTHEQLTVRLDQLSLQFRSWLGSLGTVLVEAIALDPVARAHAFMLCETAEQARYLMGPAEESLAAELTLSGGNAWGKLQGTITSQLTAEIDLDGRMQTLPMTAIINLRSHPDGDVRRRGYEVEMKAWESVAEPLAACMNGVKGEVVTLNRRRGREDALHSAIDQARIDRQTLDAMIGAMRDSLPVFRRYLRAKAQRLGKSQLPWWDIFAPMGASTRVYSYAEACNLVRETFGSFAPELAALAERAFTHNWIDVAPRPGKRGGAFCMEVPAVGESRVLTNFDGSLDQVSTLAHELGHAFHNDCAVRAGKTMLQSITPMTLAETASIMCETIITEAILARTDDPQAVLAVLETQLAGSTQVIVDIYARFLFEQEVFTRRAGGELAPAELCAIMAQAQRDSYGDGLDENYLHPYMWTWKPHYYRPTLSFYNFPYAFGLLFGTGLYAIYQERGAAFVPDYMDLLASTGEASAADLAARFGIDIRSRAFWEGSLRVIADQVERYEKL